MAEPTLVSALEVLRARYGHRSFRPAQARVIRAVLSGRDVLAVLPTGAGKSVCFQLPALLLPGLTVVVTPLISLMQDQVSGAKRRGIAAESINSATTAGERQRIEASVRGGSVRLLYVSPERLRSPAFCTLLRQVRIARLVVDEAHCISEWGHDFRPSYRRILDFRRAIGRPACVALTATATEETREDIASNLALKPLVTIVASVNRPNLRWEVARTRTMKAGARVIVNAVREARGARLVYLPSRPGTVWMAEALARRGLAAAPYHAGLPEELRRGIQERFLSRELQVVCATSAFGMGVDHPDVRLVAHLGIPGSLEAYVQESGRAGRDGGAARCLLVTYADDWRIQEEFIRASWPTARTLARIWAALPPGQPFGPPDVARLLPGLPEGCVEAALRLLAEFDCVRPPVDEHPRAPALSTNLGRVVRRPAASREWIDFGAPKRGRRRARRRLSGMRRYVTARRCRRATITDYFGESEKVCTGCDRCE